MRRNILLAIAAATLATVGATHEPAFACSMDAPPDLDSVVAGEPVRGRGESVFLGVYEFEFVAHSPGLIVVGPRSATVVTRYWGEPPPSLGPQRVGSDLGILGGDGNCGQHVGATGEIGYWYTDTRSAESSNWSRASLSLGGIDGTLTVEQESMLAARFGPPVVVGVSILDRVVAFLLAWQWQLVALVVIGGLIGGIVLFRRRRSRSSGAIEGANP